jgi:hypothetical protein
LQSWLDKKISAKFSYLLLIRVSKVFAGYLSSYLHFNLSFFFFCGTGVWTEGFTLGGQVLLLLEPVCSSILTFSNCLHIDHSSHKTLYQNIYMTRISILYLLYTASMFLHLLFIFHFVYGILICLRFSFFSAETINLSLKVSTLLVYLGKNLLSKIMEIFSFFLLILSWSHTFYWNLLTRTYSGVQIFHFLKSQPGNSFSCHLWNDLYPSHYNLKDHFYHMLNSYKYLNLIVGYQWGPITLCSCPCCEFVQSLYLWEYLFCAGHL